MNSLRPRMLVGPDMMPLNMVCLNFKFMEIGNQSEIIKGIRSVLAF